MNNIRAAHFINLARHEKVATVDFVAPIVSAMLAAESLRAPIGQRLQFTSDAGAYAATNGLRDAINGNYRQPVRGGLQGQTYSQLTRLQSTEDVDFCNTIIADLLYRQLSNQPDVAAQLVMSVGELHDNVASHADGAGFSSAQVYPQQDGRSRIEYGIADIGRGFLYNAERAQAGASTDCQAIEWAVTKGPTSGNTNDWAQRLPSDATYSPYPPSTDTTYSDNHHLGLGLYELFEVVRQLDGRLWICSGNGSVAFERGTTRPDTAAALWQGVTIEFEVLV
jgi:hypothetical protein